MLVTIGTYSVKDIRLRERFDCNSIVFTHSIVIDYKKLNNKEFVHT